MPDRCSSIEWDPDYPEVLFQHHLLDRAEADSSANTGKALIPGFAWELMAQVRTTYRIIKNPYFRWWKRRLGRLAVATCYDWLFPEAIPRAGLQRRWKSLIRISAYMDPWGVASPMEWWTLVNRVRALENTLYVVAVNQGAERPAYPPFSWPGGSCDCRL